VTALVELAIDSIAAGGDGVGRTEGLVVFVPRTAPGDLVTARIEPKGRFARGALAELRGASADRVDPPCPHYTRDRCGGCQLQHLTYEAQLAAKGGIVRDSLTRIARREVGPAEVRPSAHQWRYRRKLTLALRRRGGQWIAGLHAFDAPGQIFRLDDCPITDERVVALWREIMAASERFPRERELRGAVRLLDDGASFVLEGGASWPEARGFFDAVPGVSALWWKRAGDRPRPIADRRQVRAPGASFAQVNPAVADRLREYVVDCVMARKPTTAVDAYAGAGDTAAELAGRGVQVTAIEIDRAAAAWAGERLPAGSRAVAGRVEEEISQALPSDVVIVNPPRTGVDERVTAALAAARPRAIVYVSCNPATLARDLARLPGYQIATLLAFDMFPQTAHVETVCELVPEAA
jgi:23S rRNA (uracil1939-C5)-methyltransferase